MADEDGDLTGLDRAALLAELRRVRTHVRTHRNYADHERCLERDLELYETVLPEGGEHGGRMDLPLCTLLTGCVHYVSGQKGLKACGKAIVCYTNLDDRELFRRILTEEEMGRSTWLLSHHGFKKVLVLPMPSE